MTENIRTRVDGKLPYFVSMTKINLIYTELSFEVQETSRVKSSDVYIARKVKEVKDMTMLCATKNYNIRSCAICFDFTALKGC